MKTKAFIPAFSNGKELYFMFSMLEYDGVPVIFVCSDDDENWYLCDCVEFRDYQRWTISRTTAVVLSDILNQTLSVYDALSLSKECRVVELDYETNEYSQRMVPFSCLKHAELPQKGAMLRYHDVKAEDYVTMLRAFSIKKEPALASSVSFGEENVVKWYGRESIPLKTRDISLKVYSSDEIVYYNNAKNETDNNNAKNKTSNYSLNLAFAA